MHRYTLKNLFPFHSIFWHLQLWLKLERQEQGTANGSVCFKLIKYIIIHIMKMRRFGTTGMTNHLSPNVPQCKQKTPPRVSWKAGGQKILQRRDVFTLTLISYCFLVYTTSECGDCGRFEYSTYSVHLWLLHQARQITYTNALWRGSG